MIYAKRFFVTFLTFIMVFTFIPLVSEISYATGNSFDIANGSITVRSTSSGTTVAQGGGAATAAAAPIIITGESTQNTVVIEADSGVTADVILQGVSIVTTDTAIKTTGAGIVTIEINGTNSLQSGESCAGLQKNNVEMLIINDINNDGALTANGGMWGAGIGGGNWQAANKIEINGGTIIAQGGALGAGIGGGANGTGSYITINGGEITAKGGKLGAGIGGGFQGNGEHITINDGIIYAEGGAQETFVTGGTGIGAGQSGKGINITINGGTVTAIGVDDSAGIGGSVRSVECSAKNITISGGNVVAQGGKGGAGIGAGAAALAEDITISGGTLIAAAGERAAGIGNGEITDQGPTAISITGTAIMHVAGGAPLSEGETYGAAIGCGAGSVNGAEYNLDLSSFTGELYKYNPGTTAAQIKAGIGLLFGYGAVNVTTDGHGTATSNPTNAAIGSSVELIATPDAGYKFKEWQALSDGVSVENNRITMPGIVGNPGKNVSVKALFEQAKYTINFVNEDNTILQSSLLDFGEMPIFAGETPTKAATALCDYTFNGWTPTIVAAAEDTTYTAIYNEVPKNNQTTPTTQSRSGKSQPKENAEKPIESIGIDIEKLFASFDDLDLNAWYAEGVAYVLNRGIMKGMGDGKFVPGGTATRAQMAQILFNLSGAEKQTVTTAFSDVGEGNWFADSVNWVVKSGIAQGEGSVFGAKDPITREQLAVMLYNFAKLQGRDVSVKGSLDGYGDCEEVSLWAREAMIWAVDSEIIKGEPGENGNLKLDAEAESTRAQIAVMLQRFCERNKS